MLYVNGIPAKVCICNSSEDLYKEMVSKIAIAKKSEPQ